MKVERVWVDVPQGYLYGFPKIYEEEHDGPLADWIYRSGYPHNKEIHYTRSWQAREDDRDED